MANNVQPAERTQENNLLATVRANNSDPGLMALKRLLELRLLRLDRELRRGPPDQVPRRQAEAAFIEDTIKEIWNPPAMPASKTPTP